MDTTTIIVLAVVVLFFVVVPVASFIHDRKHKHIEAEQEAAWQAHCKQTAWRAEHTRQQRAEKDAAVNNLVNSIHLIGVVSKVTHGQELDMAETLLYRQFLAERQFTNVQRDRMAGYATTVVESTLVVE